MATSNPHGMQFYALARLKLNIQTHLIQKELQNIFNDEAPTLSTVNSWTNNFIKHQTTLDSFEFTNDENKLIDPNKCLSIGDKKTSQLKSIEFNEMKSYENCLNSLVQDYNTQIEKLIEENSNLRKENEQILIKDSEKLKKLTSENRELNLSTLKLKNELVTLRFQQCKVKQDDLVLLEKEEKELNDLNKDLYTQLNECKTQLIDLKLELEQTEERFQAQANSSDATKEQIQQMEALNKEIQMLNDQNSKLNLDIKQLVNIIDEIQNDLLQKHKLIQQTRTECAENINLIYKQNEKLKKINESLSNQVEKDLNLQTDLKHKECVILELKAELLVLRTQMDKHNEQLKHLDQEKSSLNEQISKYKSDNQNLNTEIQLITDNSTQLEKQNESLKKNLTQLVDQIVSYEQTTRQGAEFSQEVKSNFIKCKEFYKEEFNKFEKTKEEHQAQVKQFEQKIKQLKLNLDDKDKQHEIALNDSKHELSNSQNEIQMFKNMNSSSEFTGQN